MRAPGECRIIDARLPERYLTDRRVLRLSDCGFRLYVLGLLFAVANRTDGALADDDLPMIPRVTPDCADEIAGCGLWLRADGGWRIADFLTTQTSRDDLDALVSIRRPGRERKARQRATEAAKSDNPPDVTGHVTGHVTRTAQEGQEGQDRKDSTEEEPQASLPTRASESQDPAEPVNYWTRPRCTANGTGDGGRIFRPGQVGSGRTAHQRSQVRRTWLRAAATECERRPARHPEQRRDAIRKARQCLAGEPDDLKDHAP